MLATFLPLMFLTACSNSIQMTSGDVKANQIFQRGSGNGDYYSGKLENGTYARNIPDTQCGTQTMGEIIVTDNNILSREVDPQSCQVTETLVGQQSLDYAFYANSRLGLNDGLYVRQDKAPGIASEEVWCRGQNSGPAQGFDLIIKADATAKSFEAQIMTEQQTLEPLKVERDLGMFERARYRGSNFVLDIRTNSTAQWAGTIQADLKLGDKDYVLYCRLGGELDQKSSLRPF